MTGEREGMEPLWHHAEAAKWLGVSVWTLYQLVHRDEDPLPASRIGRVWRYVPMDVREWVRRQGRTAIAAGAIERWEGR